MKGKSLIITLCIVAICGLLAYIGYNTFKKDVTELKTETVQTVDQSVAAFIASKNAYTVEQVYFALPETTFATIVTRIGTTATKEEIVAEYQRNKEYYLSLQLSEKIGEVPIEGPDAKNVESASITVQLKGPDTTKVPIIPATVEPTK